MLQLISTPRLADAIDPLDYLVTEVCRKRSELHDAYREAHEDHDERRLERIAKEARTLSQDFDAIYCLAVDARDRIQEGK